MYTARNINPGLILKFAWRALILFTFWSTWITIGYHVFDYKWLSIPFLPIGVVGTAVAFYIGFKSNSSYERLWEGRRIWGSFTNLSRTLGAYCTGYVNGFDEEHTYQLRRQLTRNHLAYINAVRIQLRRSSVWLCQGQIDVRVVESHAEHRRHTLDEDVAPYLDPSDWERVKAANNPATQIMNVQSELLAKLNRDVLMSDLRHMEMGKLIKELYDQQGACERIKTFPFPRQYGFFSRLFVWIFILILPFGMVPEFAKLSGGQEWLAIPICVLLSWIFYTMEVVGDTSENPFENGINDVPMTAICRNIEIDMLQMLGNEKNVPERLNPVANILM